MIEGTISLFKTLYTNFLIEVCDKKKLIYVAITINFIFLKEFAYVDMQIHERTQHT